jgi:hypothetical protein
MTVRHVWDYRRANRQRGLHSGLEQQRVRRVQVIRVLEPTGVYEPIPHTLPDAWSRCRRLPCRAPGGAWRTHRRNKWGDDMWCRKPDGLYVT